MKKIAVYTVILLSIILALGFIVQRHLRIQKINDHISQITNEDFKYKLHESLLNYYRTEYNDPDVNELIEYFRNDQHISTEWINEYLPKKRIRVITDTSQIFIYSTLPNNSDDTLKSGILVNPIGFFDCINGDVLILKADRFNQHLSEVINGVITYQSGIAIYDSMYNNQLLDSLKAEIITALEPSSNDSINQFKKYILRLVREKNGWRYKLLVNPCSNQRLIQGVKNFTTSDFMKNNSVLDSIYLSFYLDVNRLTCQ